VKNHTQFYSVNKNVSVFYTNFITTGNNSTRRVHTDIYRITAGKVKFCEVTAVTYLVAYFSFYPYFPHLLTDMLKILYSKSAHAVMEYLWVSWHLMKENMYFTYGRERNYIYPVTIKLYDILKVNKVLVKSIKSRRIPCAILLPDRHSLYFLTNH
jgi:hypothetical protein